MNLNQITPIWVDAHPEEAAQKLNQVLEDRSNDWAEIVKKLIQCGVAPNAELEDGRHVADFIFLGSADEDLLQFLVEHGANFEHLEESNFNPLYHCYLRNRDAWKENRKKHRQCVISDDESRLAEQPSKEVIVEMERHTEESLLAKRNMFRPSSKTLRQRRSVCEQPTKKLDF